MLAGSVDCREQLAPGIRCELRRGRFPGTGDHVEVMPILMREREPRESRLWTHLDQVQTCLLYTSSCVSETDFISNELDTKSLRLILAKSLLVFLKKQLLFDFLLLQRSYFLNALLRL